MASHVQVYNPVANQRVKKDKLNVMGRVTNSSVQSLAVFLNNFLIRRIKPSKTGAFECHIDLRELPEGEHQIEIRAVIRHNTQRIRISFYRVVPEAEDTDAESEDQGA